MSGGTNDVFSIGEGLSPAAYAGGLNNIANGCIGPDGGFADLGDPAQGYAYTSKKHQYVFNFAAPVSDFSVRMADWGDFLPFGANADHRYAMILVAYNAASQPVAVDTIEFTSEGTQANNRISNEYGNLAIAGDACRATPGQPGNYTFHVHGADIVRITLAPKDRPSTDPHIAFANLCFTLESRHVQVDVKPGDPVNAVNLKAKGTLPAAILGAADFDVTTVLPETIRLASAAVAKRPNGTLRTSIEDVNGDGFPDLVFHVNIADLSGASTVFRLTAQTAGGGTINGEDTVVFVP
jgi:hypothetical protein